MSTGKNRQNLLLFFFLSLFFTACDEDSKSDQNSLRILEQEVVLQGGKTDTVAHDVFRAYEDPSFLMQNGKYFSWDSLKGKIFVADVFFSRCPKVCPKLSASMSQLHQEYGDNPNIRFLSVSVDPKHDTLEVIQEYAKSYDARPDRWYFLTGNQDSIYDFAHKAFLFKAYESDSGEIAFIHDENLMLVDPEGRIRFGEEGFYNGTKADEVQLLKRDMNLLMKEYGYLEEQ